MTERSNMLRSGGRAITGLLITGAAAVGALALGSVDVPNLVSDPHAITVDTTQRGERTLVCSGAFSELGADPGKPDVAAPVGEADVVAGADSTASDPLGASGARVYTAAAQSQLQAAQVQQIASATLSGLAASSCTEPVNEQWVLGGSTSGGYSSTLTVGNAGSVAATVHISVFDEEGAVDSLQTSGVIVAPHSQQVVSLNGYAPGRERLAVKVTSTGAPVSASIGVSQLDNIVPVGIATVTRQLQAETRLVIPAAANSDDPDHEAAPNDTGPGDRFPLLVQALSTAEHDATATAYAVDAAGKRTQLGTLELTPNAVASLTVKTWPKSANAVVIESEVPILGGVLGQSNSGEAHDFDWFSPAPEIPAGVPVSAPVVNSGTLMIVNPGDSEANVSLDADGKNTVTIPAGAAAPVKAAKNTVVMSDTPVYAGVRVLGAATIAGYPILPSTELGGELTVYTR